MNKFKLAPKSKWQNTYTSMRNYCIQDKSVDSVWVSYRILSCPEGSAMGRMSSGAISVTIHVLRISQKADLFVSKSFSYHFIVLYHLYRAYMLDYSRGSTWIDPRLNHRRRRGFEILKLFVGCGTGWKVIMSLLMGYSSKTWGLTMGPKCRRKWKEKRSTDLSYMYHEHPSL